MTLLSLLALAEAACGDRVPDEVEECDDGNLVSGDGCSDRCVVEEGWVCEPLAFGLTEYVDLQDDMGLAEPAWFFRADYLLATQLLDAGPSVYLSDARVEEGLVAFGLRVTDPDRDFVGFTIGLEPGEQSDPEGDWLLVDWKGEDEEESCGWAPEGLAVSRVRGAPTSSELWCHSGVVEELEGGVTLANTGWSEGETHIVEIDADSDHLTVWVDGELQFDRADSLPMGALGFYTLSQQDATFELFQPLSVDVCSNEEGFQGGYSGGLCTGCATGPTSVGWLGVFALALLRRRR